jgi:hypothetical protein
MRMNKLKGREYFAWFCSKYLLVSAARIGRVFAECTVDEDSPKFVLKTISTRNRNSPMKLKPQTAFVTLHVLADSTNKQWQCLLLE